MPASPELTRETLLAKLHRFRPVVLQGVLFRGSVTVLRDSLLYLLALRHAWVIWQVLSEGSVWQQENSAC
jgi:hypothetical protein